MPVACTAATALATEWAMEVARSASSGSSTTSCRSASPSIHSRTTYARESSSIAS
jgi:hypothetical protein